MLRITTNRNDLRVVLKLEGQLIGPWVNELEEACVSAREASSKVILNLADLNFTDQTGSKLLAVLAHEGIELKGCSGFIRAQIRSHA